MDNTFKIIIAGSRDFTDYEKLCKFCDTYTQKILEEGFQIEIVSGRARGADFLGEKYATERNFHLKIFPANWDKFGTRAGYIRNKEMATYANALIAFWDGNSRGTGHMIDLAKKFNLKISTIIF